MPTFEVVPGLPPYGPMAIAFPASGRGAHKRGFVVRFTAKAGEVWVGNFQPGFTCFSGACAHPDAMHVVVVSGGDIYVVDPEARSADEQLGGMVASITPLPERNSLLFDETLRLSLIDATGLRWRTKRLSWDGIRNLSVAADFIHGEGWRYDDTWHEFEVSVDTGKTKGGAYTGPG